MGRNISEAELSKQSEKLFRVSLVFCMIQLSACNRKLSTASTC